jgi:proliferating cell nuclear antigen
MLLKLDSPKIFADIISIISELVTEVKLKVSSEGMFLTALDPANVAMVYFKLPRDLFSEFQLDISDETVSLGVNLSNLKAILRRCQPGVALIIEKKDSMLKFSILERVKREFSLALIDIDTEEKEMRDWEFASIIKIPAQSFVEAIEDCSIVSDACTFIAEPSKFVLEAKGINSARIEFSSEEVEIYSANSTARYSLEYLSKFIKGAKIASYVKVGFSNNDPLKIDFITGQVVLSFVLAPRIEQDD